MQLSEKVITYIQSSHLPQSINSNFLITDLEKVLYAATYDANAYYTLKFLSEDLINLIHKWDIMPCSEDIFFMENDTYFKIISNDTEKYSALMIFPIYLNNKLERPCYLF